MTRRNATRPAVMSSEDLAIASVVTSALDIALSCAYESSAARGAIASIEAARDRQTTEAASRVLTAIVNAIRSEVQS